jgi:hypothetical protein
MSRAFSLSSAGTTYQGPVGVVAPRHSSCVFAPEFALTLHEAIVEQKIDTRSPIAVDRAVSDSNSDHSCQTANFGDIRSSSTQTNMDLMIAAVEQGHAQWTFVDFRAVGAGMDDAAVDAAWILHVN